MRSLAQILPVSLARAKECADRLGKLAAEGPVDMSDFLLQGPQQGASPRIHEHDMIKLLSSIQRSH